ncbi:MAG: IPT/TIG domain-containing protein [Ignavibacteriae bacterium]|nr:IPT/TIG domain-containing protein [Ignavibacteriota bacterium]
MKKIAFAGALLLCALLWSCESEDNSAASLYDVKVSSVNPMLGREGTVVTITGENFGTDKTKIAVVFGNASSGAVIDAITPTQITARVPVNTAEGNIKISVMKGFKTADVPFRAFNAIVSSWASEGQLQVAPGLWDSLKVRRVLANFTPEGAYTMQSTDSAGTTTQYAGTYKKTGPNSSRIFGDTLFQTAPSAVTYRGIYRVVNDTLSLEVIQTAPPVTGWTAALPDSGFGSTKRNNVRQGTRWVQKFIRQQ